MLRKHIFQGYNFFLVLLLQLFIKRARTDFITKCSFRNAGSYSEKLINNAASDNDTKYYTTL